MKNTSNKLFGGLIALVLSGTVSAQAQADDDLWNSAIELGAVFTSGNTEEENFKFKGTSVRDGERIRNSFGLDSLRASKNNAVTAQKLYTSYQLDYKFDDSRALFGRVAYEDDRFSGYDFQTDFTAGYTQTLFANERMKLTGDAGLGYRQSELTTGGDEGEGIVRLAGVFTWNLSDNALFSQYLSTEIGGDSTISRSETTLESRVIGDLAMKLAVKIKNNSEVPLGLKKTDTESSVTLVYKF